MNNIKCSVYLRVTFISLKVDVGGGVYSRAALNRVNMVYWPAYAIYYVHLSMHSVVSRRLGMRLPYTCTSTHCMSSSHLLMLAPFSALCEELDIEHTSVGFAHAYPD